MAAANIVIDQPAHPTTPTGQPGKARNDIVLASPVQLRNENDTGVRSHRWLILDQPDLSSPDVLSNPTAAAPTFTPNAEGTYRIRLTVNQGRKGEVATTVLTIQNEFGQRVPAAGEGDEANWDDPDTAAPNTRGWWLAMRDHLKRRRQGYTLGGSDAVSSGIPIYMSWWDFVEDTAPNGNRVGLGMPNAGRVIKVTLQTNNDLGNPVVVAVHKNNSATVIASASVDMTGEVGTNIDFVLSTDPTDQHWDADEEVHISVNPNDTGNLYTLHALIEFRE